MFKLNEKNARKIISAAAILAVLALVVFIGETKLYTVMAEQPTEQEVLAPAIEELKKQQEAMARQLEENKELQEQLNTLEARLEEAQQSALEIENRNLTLTDDVVMEYAGEFKTTAYCCEEYKHICGGNGVTASGTKPTPGLTCAADWDVFKPGTWLYIEDVGVRRVEDSGSAIIGQKLDIAIDTHDNALSWSGFGKHRVWVLGFGSVK